MKKSHFLKLIKKGRNNARIYRTRRGRIFTRHLQARFGYGARIRGRIVVTRATEKDKLFGAKVKELRLGAKKSRNQVATKLGISQQQLEKYEVASNRISAGRLVELAKVLDVGFLELVPEEVLELNNVDNLAIYLWQKLSYQNKKIVINVIREMIK
jgi:transcriptional regulator with XRE-family HTH domain